MYWSISQSDVINAHWFRSAPNGVVRFVLGASTIGIQSFGSLS